MCLKKDTFAISPEVMLEEYIKGREVSCAVLGNREPEALPVVEIIPHEKYRFFSYTAKYETGASQEICPAQISSDVYKKIQDFAIKARSHNIYSERKIWKIWRKRFERLRKNRRNLSCSHGRPGFVKGYSGKFRPLKKDFHHSGIKD